MASITRAQKVRLGIFVGTGLLLMLTTVMLLAGRAMLEKRDSYVVRFEGKKVSFSGLTPGSDVKYSGLKIGRVDALGISPQDVSVIEVEISVKSGTPIATDSVARLASMGITGLKYIELTRGSAKAGIRKPGDTIPAGETLIDELSEKAASITDRLDALIANLQDITSPQARQDVQTILTSASGILTDNRENIKGILTDAKAVSSDLSAFSQKGVEVADRADKLLAKLDKVGSELEAVLSPQGEVLSTVRRTNEVVERVNMLMMRSENDLDVALRHLREASANLSDFSADLRENPTILINNSREGESR